MLDTNAGYHLTEFKKEELRIYKKCYLQDRLTNHIFKDDLA